MTDPLTPRGVLVGLLVATLLVAAAAFVGPAAANGGPTIDSVVLDDDEAWIGTTSAHTVTVNASDVNTTDGPATVELDLTDWTDGDVASVNKSDVTVTGGAELVEPPETTDGLVTLAVDDTTAGVVDVDLAVAVELTHPTTPSGEATYGVGVSVTDAVGEDVVARSENAFRVVPEALSAGFADGTVDSTGQGAESSFRVDSNRGGSLAVDVTARGLDADELFALFGGETDDAVERHGGGVRLTDLDPGTSVSVDFDAVPAASYDLDVVATDTNATATASVDVEERDVDASFGDGAFESTAGDFVEFDVSLEGLDEAYLLVGGDRADDGGLTNFLDVLHVRGDTDVVVNTRLLGTNAPSESVYLSDGSVVSYAHAPDDPVFDNVTFADADGGEVATDLAGFRRELGVTGPPGPLQPGRYRVVAGADGDVVVREDGVPDFERPLDRSNVYLTAPELGNVTTHVAPAGSASAVDDPDDVGDLREQLTARTTVAKGDRLVVEFEATGLFGTLSWLAPGEDPLSEAGVPPSVLSRLLELPEGVTLDGTQTDAGANEDPTELALADATDGDAYLLADSSPEDAAGGSAERYYLVVDTRGSGPFDAPPAPGDAFDLELGVRGNSTSGYRFDHVDHADKTASDDAVDHYPYLDPGANDRTRSRRVAVESPTVGYDRTDLDGRPVAVNATNATVAGWTNVAPATETTVQLLTENRSGRDPLAVEPVDVDENGTFAFEHDLSGRDAGETVYLEFYADERLVDGRYVRLVESPEAFPAVGVAEVPSEVSVRDGGTGAVTTRLRNAGTIDGRSRVELRVDGEVVDRRSVTVRGEETTGVDLDVPTAGLSPGTYDYSVLTPEDRANGTLVVEASPTPTPDGGPDGGANESSTATPPSNGTNASDAGEDAPDGEPGAGGGLFGLPIPVGGRHAVGGAIVVGAVYVSEHWL